MMESNHFIRKYDNGQVNIFYTSVESEYFLHLLFHLFEETFYIILGLEMCYFQRM